MMVKRDGKYEVCCAGMKSLAYSVDVKGVIYVRKLRLKFESFGEVLAYVDRLEGECREYYDKQKEL